MFSSRRRSSFQELLDTSPSRAGPPQSSSGPPTASNTSSRDLIHAHALKTPPPSSSGNGVRRFSTQQTATADGKDLTTASSSAGGGYGGAPAPPTNSSGGGTHLLSRHDLILEEDISRVLEAYFSVDEHRKMYVTIPEGEEVFRIVGVKSDRAALARLKNAAGDDEQVAALRRSGLSAALLWQHVGLKDVATALPSPAAATSPGRHMSAVSVTGLISFLSLMRAFFPSYPKKVVEKVVMQCIPPPLPACAVPVVDQARLLFRACRSADGQVDDTDDGFVSYRSLMTTCHGMDAEQLEAMVLRHSPQMEQYLLADCKAFEELRIADLFRHVHLPAPLLQGTRSVPPLSMLNFIACWEVLRPQLTAVLSLAQQVRLSQLVVFMKRYGAPAAFRVKWSPNPQDDPPRYDIHVEVSCGVDGCQRRDVNVDDVRIDLPHLAVIIASPTTPPPPIEPYLSAVSAALRQEHRVVSFGVPKNSAQSVGSLSSQGLSPMGRNSPGNDGRRVLKLARPGLCITKPNCEKEQSKNASAVATVPKGQSTPRTPHRSVGEVVDPIGLLNSLSAACERDNTCGLGQTESACPHSPATATEHRYPSLAEVKLREQQEMSHKVLRELGRKFEVPYVRLAEANGATAYHSLQSPPDGGPSGETLVLKPRDRGAGRVVPLTPYQRKHTPQMFNYSHGEPPPVAVRPKSARPPSATHRQPQATEPLLCSAVSRPLGFTGVRWNFNEDDGGNVPIAAADLAPCSSQPNVFLPLWHQKQGGR